MFTEDSISKITTAFLPARNQFFVSKEGLSISRRFSHARSVAVSLAPYRSRKDICRRMLAQTADGENIVLENAKQSWTYDDSITAVLRIISPTIDGSQLNLSASYFLSGRNPVTAEELSRAAAEARETWLSGVRYTSEIIDAHGTVIRSGWRRAQAGALHAIAAHWTVSNEPAVVVLPTGTGKTEIMIAAAIESAAERVLVIVPTDTLRQQTAGKFHSYGILNSLNLVSDLANPVIGILSSKPKREQFELIQHCNVVISTMSSIGLADNAVQQDFAAQFSHVFFDEAHHIEAATWNKFKKNCPGKRLLLLTATPFRQDGKLISGEFIYDFPLSDAQEQGYFAPISFVEVFEPNEARADFAIAEKAVAQLRSDLQQGYDHLLMARAKTIEAAEDLYRNVYLKYYSDLNPVLIHSQIPKKQPLLQSVRDREHKIIVCVDMFGEGFDLPQLKIAALHAVHKSLGVTLQFVGRFARSAAKVGGATFVANTAEDGVPEALENLYQEDADWNILLPDFSYDAIAPQKRLSDLVKNLEQASAGQGKAVELSALTLRPTLSARVYRAEDFDPSRFADAFRPKQRVLQPQISRRDNLLIFVVNQQELLDWTDSKDISVDNWDLYLVYFDQLKKLLYVHCSRKGDSTGVLAKAVSSDPVLISGELVFKVFAGLRRLTLHSVGLSSLSRNVRYQMFAGLDVRDAIDPIQQQSKMKSNITGVGYEDGERRSVGCSRHGKIWSMKSGSIAEWVDWCDRMGAKLADSTTEPDTFLQYTLLPSAVKILPSKHALLADWPDQLFEISNFRFEVFFKEQSYDFHECEISLLQWNPGGTSFSYALRVGPQVGAEYELKLVPGDEEGTYDVERISGEELEIVTGKRRSDDLSFFKQNPPLIRLEDGSQLSGNILLKPQEEMNDLFDSAHIQILDWDGVDLTKESRWRESVLRPDSIQEHFCNVLIDGGATFVIDDDDTGESADIIAIEESADTILVYLWHCKFSSEADAGNRVKDLYEVCGQAEKSVKWTWNFRNLVSHLTLRETKHCGGRSTRFVKGSLSELVTLRKASRKKFIKYRIGIVQPGLSKSGIPQTHLAILGATSSFVRCITEHPLLVVASV